MLQYGDPSMTSIEQGMDQDEVGKLALTTLSKPLLEFFDSGFNSVDLEAENYKQYIHIRLNHITKNFENGEMVRTDTYHEMERCKEEYF